MLIISLLLFFSVFSFFHETGPMEKTSVRCATNSISRFILLVSCQTLKSMPAQIEYGKVAASLKLLKPVLDEVVDHKIYANEKLLNECEDLDIAVSEAREFMENWCPKMSKICSVRIHSFIIISLIF